MLVLPENIIKKLLDGILTKVKSNYTGEAVKADSILYQLFYGNKIGKYDYYVQSVKLFVDRGINDPRKIHTRVMFDPDRVHLPTIHIVLPSKLPSDGDAIGIDSGYQDNFITSDNRVIEVLTRTFRAQYNLVITSDNPTEVMLIYYLIEALLVSIFDSFELNGLMNPQLSAQDLQLNSELIPKGIFVRSIGLSVSNEVNVPKFITVDTIKNLIFNNEEVKYYVETITVTSETGFYIIDVDDGTLQMLVAVLPPYADDITVTWSSSDEEKATIDVNGLVTAISDGVIQIRATANDGTEVYGEKTVTISNQT